MNFKEAIKKSNGKVFKSSNTGFYTFEIRHMFGSTYCDTIEELNEMHSEVINWVNATIVNEYKITPFDNAAFSDYNEDPWVGYYFAFEKEEDAVLFKTTWL